LHSHEQVDVVYATESLAQLELTDRESIRIDRPEGMPVPNRLNVALVLLDVAAAVGLLWLGSWLDSTLGVIVVAIAYSYLMLTNYALLHEATHDNLHENAVWNYWLGVITGVLFLAPFSMIRVTHQGHHQRNRTDAEIFDLYYPQDSFFWKCCQWYATLTGLFWPCIPVCAVLFAIVPRTVGMQLFSGPPLGNANVKDITSKDLKWIRLELLLTLVVFGLLFWLLQLRWQAVLLMYACFSFNWSTRQYIGHAFSKREIIEGAWNLRHNKLMSLLLLHGEWDLNHHRHPELSWYYLPGDVRDDDERPGYIRHYLRQWLGPRPAGPPPRQSQDAG
jgi:fatty acid desaturase